MLCRICAAQIQPRKHALPYIQIIQVRDLSGQNDLDHASRNDLHDFLNGLGNAEMVDAVHAAEGVDAVDMAERWFKVLVVHLRWSKLLMRMRWPKTVPCS